VDQQTEVPWRITRRAVTKSTYSETTTYLHILPSHKYLYLLAIYGSIASNVAAPHVCAYTHMPEVFRLVFFLSCFFNPLTPELNPSAQRYLTRFFTGDFAS
jgi:hypothetical protein